MLQQESQQQPDRGRLTIRESEQISGVLARLRDSDDNKIANIARILIKAKTIARDEVGQAAVEELTTTLEKYEYVRRVGLSVDEYLRQGTLFTAGPPLTSVQQGMLGAFEKYGVGNKLQRLAFAYVRNISSFSKMSDAELGGPQTMPLFQRAFHGSPHTFDKFSTEKIGTGEGAQAYGWGLYFAGKKEVAEFYRSKLANDQPSTRVLVNGKRLIDLVPNNLIASEIGAALLRNDLNVARAVEDADVDKPEVKRYLQSLAKSEITVERPGRTYEVEMVPADDEYLVWDKPLSEQSDKVKKALTEAGIFEPETKPEWKRNDAQDIKGDFYQERWLKGQAFIQKGNEGWFFGARGGTEFKGLAPTKELAMKHAEPYADKPIPITGRKFYHDLSNSPISGAENLTSKEGDIRPILEPQGASAKLHSLGIRGIKYLDEGSRANNLVEQRLQRLLDKHNGDAEAAVDEFMRTVHNTPKEKERMRRDFLKSLQGITYNYVIFDDSDVSIQAMFKRGESGVAGWLKRRKAQLQSLRIRMATTDVLLREAKVEGAAHRLKLNEAAYEIFKRMYEQHEQDRTGKRQEHPFTGVFNDPTLVRDLLNRLREISREHPSQRNQAAALARALKQAAEADRTAILYTEDEALIAEYFHRASYLGSGGKSLIDRHARFQELAASDAVKKAGLQPDFRMDVTHVLRAVLMLPNRRRKPRYLNPADFEPATQGIEA